MGKILDDTVDFVKDVVDFVVDDVLRPIWKGTIAILEKVFSLFGIEDETFIIVEKSSSLVYDSEGVDLVAQANKKAIISMLKENSSFFDWRSIYINANKTDITYYYLYAKNGGYVHGLPTMEMRGGDVDYTAIDSALALNTGLVTTRLSVTTVTPDDEIYFKHKIQTSPYFYIPWNNTLTFTDPDGVDRTDYTLNSVNFNTSSGKHELEISRISQETLFWIEGASTIVEGGSAKYVIKSNRTVPTGKKVDIYISYEGTALTRRYVKVPVVTLLENTNEVEFIITTDENTISDGNKTIVVSIAYIDNTFGAFELANRHPVDSVTTVLIDNDSLVLTLASTVVAEGAGSVTVPITLESATTAFTVDFSTSNGTAESGLDYTATSGTLSFTGEVGEVNNVTIPILTDAIAEYTEYFSLILSNTSNALVDISNTCRVVVTDGSLSFSTPSNKTITNKIIFNGYIREPSMIVTYHETVNTPTEWFYWIYKYSTNTYPALNDSARIISDLEMLPIVVLKDANGAVDVNKDTPEYKTAKKMLDILSMDIDSILDGIRQDPNYNVVNDLYLNFSLSPLSNIEVVSKGLWISFHNLLIVNGITSTTNEYIATLVEQAINNAVTWTDYIYTQGIVGTLPNSVTHDHFTVIVPEIIDYDGTVSQEGISTLTLDFQVSTGIYDRLEIINLNTLSIIKKDNFSDIAINVLGDTQFTIPVSYFVISQMTAVEQLKLYEHIVRLDTYAADIIELEWYQTRKFANLFTFVATFISVVTLGLASGPIEVIKQLIYQYLVSELVKVIAVKTGNAELAALVGLVALIAGSNASGSIIDFTSAEGLVLASTNFADNLTKGYGIELERVKEEMDFLNSEAEKRLKENKDLFGEPNPITPEFLVALNSVDTTSFPAIKAQYDYDLIFDYDRLIADYYNLSLRTGVS